MQLIHFSIDGKLTEQHWGVYIILATPKSEGKKAIYVGKVGDNNEGCSTIISRIGNHFGFSGSSKQMRDGLVKTELFDYDITFAPVAEYSGTDEDLRGITNEFEANLIQSVSKWVKDENLDILNVNEKNIKGEISTDSIKPDNNIDILLQRLRKKILNQ